VLAVGERVRVIGLLEEGGLYVPILRSHQSLFDPRVLQQLQVVLVRVRGDCLLCGEGLCGLLGELFLLNLNFLVLQDLFFLLQDLLLLLILIFFDEEVHLVFVVEVGVNCIGKE